MTFWSWTRQAGAIWGFGLFIVFVAVVVRHVLLPFALAGLLAYVLAPPVDRLARLRPFGRPLPRFMAVIAVYTALLAGLAIGVGLFVPRLSADVARLVKEAPPFFARVRTQHAPRVSRWLEEITLVEGAPGKPRPELAVPFPLQPPMR